MSFFNPTPAFAKDLIKRNPSPACNILPDDQLWCLSGGYSNNSGGGILRWCYSQEDANYWKEVYELSGNYVNLSVSKYQD